MSKIVLVEWEDSNVIHGWQHGEDVVNQLVHCRTVGIVQFEDDHIMTVAMGDSDCGSVLEPITIPKGCITKIKELRTK